MQKKEGPLENSPNQPQQSQKKNEKVSASKAPPLSTGNKIQKQTNNGPGKTSNHNPGTSHATGGGGPSSSSANKNNERFMDNDKSYNPSFNPPDRNSWNVILRGRWYNGKLIFPQSLDRIKSNINDTGAVFAELKALLDVPANLQLLHGRFKELMGKDYDGGMENPFVEPRRPYTDLERRTAFKVTLLETLRDHLPCFQYGETGCHGYNGITRAADHPKQETEVVVIVTMEPDNCC